MNRDSFFYRYGIEILMLTLSIGLGAWFSMPRAQQQLIKLPDTLRVVTLYGATTYFKYKSEELGQQYDLIKEFAHSINRPIALTIAPDLESTHLLIANGEADISITPESVSSSSRLPYDYAGPEQTNSIVLVQRKRSPSDTHNEYISNVAQLLGKAVYVLPGTRFEDRLGVLQEQLGGEILSPIVSPDSTTSIDSLKKEDLISMISTRQIDYALIDKDLALLSSRYYPQVDMTLEVGFPQRLQWIVRKDNPPLMEALAKWASSRKDLPKKKNIYRKYLEVNKPNEYLLSSNYQGEKTYISSGKISPFDALFQDESLRLGWDWEVLASIAYQESNFIPDIIGRSGARGLMGIMPRTGQAFGANADQLLDPQVSVRVSVDCLLAFSKYFKSIDDVEQKMKFTLAAYNAGIAHIQDAQRLAEKYGSDPKRWDGNVEEYIRLKSEAQYYRDPVCKYGYLRGIETYNYVSKVTSRAKMYKSYTTK